MSRKVFISFLGTNNYLQTKYIINGNTSKPVRFVQEALADDLCVDWPDDSRIMIFYTEESKKCNWLDGGQPRMQEDAEIENCGLEGILKNKPYGSRVEGYQIPEGFSVEEVWSIFDIVYSKLENDDQVYFDVTHAFRSIPLFSTILFQYASFMKGISLCQVCYGAFEKLGPAYKVKNFPIDDRLAPVLDLNNIIQLQNLTQVANSFTQYGKISEVGKAFEQVGDKRLENLVKEFGSAVSKLEDYILSNKIDKIEEGAFVHDIKISMKNIRKKGTQTKAQIDILDKLEANISEFKPNGGLNNIIAAFNWALKYKMIIQAHVMALESIVSYTLDVIRDKTVLFEEELSKRNFVASILGISSADKKNRNYKKELACNVELTEEVFAIPLIHDLRKPFGIISQNRNELCHGKRSDRGVSGYEGQLRDNFKKCMDFLKNVVDDEK